MLIKPIILSAVEIVPIHTSPKRKRGNDLATSLALRVSVSLNREEYRTEDVVIVFARRVNSEAILTKK